MFSLKDDFKSFDDNKIPYSFSVERHTETENLHVGVTDEGFSFKSIGNRFILNTPVFKTGAFSTKFKINYLAEFNPKFYIFFQYDRQKRTGKGLFFEYDLKDTFSVALVNVDKMAIDVIETKKITGICLNDSTFYSLNAEIKEDLVECIIEDKKITFNCENKKGNLAIERKNFIGELIFNEIEFCSNDEFDCENVLPARTVDIPLRNGGDIPYKFTWEINRLESDYYLLCSLDGGTKTRKLNREDRPGQYSVERDFMDFPYVGIRVNNNDNKYYLFSKKIAFIDPNIFWECQKEFFGDVEIPIKRCFKLDEFNIDEDIEIIFGYKNLLCSCYATQMGAGEFRYDINGNMLYSGEPVDGKDIYEVFSPFDKKVISYIPEVCYKREEAIEHIKYNHYFDVTENIDFTLNIKTKTQCEYLSVKARILNIYETEIIDEKDADFKFVNWKYGYMEGESHVTFGKLEVGVYKIEFLIYYGDKLYNKIMKVFEVMDENSDEIPALKSGLPFMFSMPNELKWLMRNSFDLWNPARSCNIEHYISCVTDTPIEAETRKVWEVIKPFKREWFAWLAKRTCREWSPESHPEIIANADYLYNSIETEMHPIRNDLWKINNYRRDEFMKIFYSFLHDNPEIAEKLDYKEGMPEFTYAHLKNLMDTCHKEWVNYAVEKLLLLFKEQNERFKEVNPKVKRSIYGPFNIYVSPTNTYQSIKAYGLPCDERLAEDVYTGFTIFEDYPYSCSYQTYRGPFAIMTVLAHIPKLRVYIEQYKGGIGGCIDGAVKFANPPMGAYNLEPYQNSTHTFEFVFNTPHKLADGYHYWSTYGFHRPDYKFEMMDELVKDWTYVIENKPKKPVKSLAFIAEYTDDEDVYDDSIIDLEGFAKFNNRSDNSHGVIHECSREAGVPNGFALKFDTLKTLSADECDLLILPTLKGVKEEYIKEIRRLYNDGVNLIAVSDIDGLEDIFKVEKSPETVKVNCLEYNGATEYIYERNAELTYKPCGADVIVKGNDNTPCVIATERTALINTALTELGAECFEGVPGRSRRVVGTLIRNALKDIIRTLSRPLVYSDNMGLSLFETESGKTTILAIDYTPFDNTEKGVKQAVVNVNMDDVIDAKSNSEIMIGKKDGVVKELRFDIKPHGFVFIDLEK